MRARYLLLLALTGCVSGAMSGAVPLDLCSEPVIDRASWAPDTLRGFRIRIPPGYRTLPYQGIDSDVAGWSRGSRHLMYDFGEYSGPYQPSPGATDAAECQAVVGGDTVAIATYRTAEARYGVHAYWLRAVHVPVVPAGTSRSRLMLYGEASDATGLRELLAMIWSVRLPQ